MKQFFLLVLIFSTLVATAQPAEQKKLDESSIIRDTAGAQISYTIWKALLNTGNYTLVTPKNMPFTDYVLKRLSPEEKQKLIEKAPPPPESKYFRTGEKIRSFSDKDLKGNKYKLKDMQGKIVVLNFWFVNCPPCKKEIPELNALVKEFASNPDVVFIAPALDPRYDIEDFLKTTPFEYNIIENARYIADLYGIKSYPTHVVIDREGMVRFHTSGLALKTVPAIKKAIGELLSKPPANSN